MKIVYQYLLERRVDSFKSEIYVKFKIRGVHRKTKYIVKQNRVGDTFKIYDFFVARNIQ